MRVHTQNGVEEYCEGEDLRVSFTGQNAGGPFGFVGNYKVILAPGIHQVHAGETWICREILRWKGGSDRPSSQFQKEYQQWGNCIYVWPETKLA